MVDETTTTESSHVVPVLLIETAYAAVWVRRHDNGRVRQVEQGEDWVCVVFDVTPPEKSEPEGSEE